MLVTRIRGRVDLGVGRWVQEDGFILSRTWNEDKFWISYKESMWLTDVRAIANFSFLLGSLYSPQIRGQPTTPSLAAPGAPSLQYSTQDLMMVLVNMQKEAQRREESLQRSLLHVKERLQSQVSQERF